MAAGTLTLPWEKEVPPPVPLPRELQRFMMTVGGRQTEGLARQQPAQLARLCLERVAQIASIGVPGAIELQLQDWLAQQPELTLELARDPNPTVRGQLARLDIPLCRQLRHEQEPAVRRALAANREIARPLLLALARDKTPTVRMQIAMCRDCPLAVLRQLINDPDQDVAAQAACHPRQSPAARAMWQLAHDQPAR
jgi:hypothetical protein